jgi:hypothetical protein
VQFIPEIAVKKGDVIKATAKYDLSRLEVQVTSPAYDPFYPKWWYDMKALEERIELVSNQPNFSQNIHVIVECWNVDTIHHFVRLQNGEHDDVICWESIHWSWAMFEFFAARELLYLQRNRHRERIADNDEFLKCDLRKKIYEKKNWVFLDWFDFVKFMSSQNERKNFWLQNGLHIELKGSIALWVKITHNGSEKRRGSTWSGAHGWANGGCAVPKLETAVP